MNFLTLVNSANIQHIVIWSNEVVANDFQAQDSSFKQADIIMVLIVAGEREHEAGHARAGDGGARRGGAGGGDQGVPDGAAVQGDAPRLVRGAHAEHEALLL